MQQWSSASSGKKYNMKNEIAKTFHRLTRDKCWQQIEDLGVSHKTLDTVFVVHNAFLRKLILHDLYVSHRVGELDTDVVGGGAREMCLRGTGWRGNTDSAKAMREAPQRLARLHKWLDSKLKPLDRFVKQVLPHGFLLRHAQHACCELRKWVLRKNARKGRKRCVLEAAQRAKVRRARVSKLWRCLGFKKIPAACKP